MTCSNRFLGTSLRSGARKKKFKKKIENKKSKKILQRLMTFSAIKNVNTEFSIPNK